MGTPADVIKTRIMCQPVDANGKYYLKLKFFEYFIIKIIHFKRGIKYKSSLHCLKLTFKNEGFFGLYKGYWPTWLRMVLRNLSQIKTFIKYSKFYLI